MLVDRLSFIAWIEGTMLDGNDKDDDQQICRDAEQHLYGGGELFLTVKGKVVSKIIIQGDSFLEVKCES